MPGPPPQALPTSSADLRAITVALARQMLASVGAGWQAPNGSNNAADALALGASFADLRAELLGVWAQIFVSSATSNNGLLSEWEALLAIPIDNTLPDADRQARLVAFMRSAIAGTPQGIESAVASYAGSCTVVETSAADVEDSNPPLMPEPRQVFFFAVVVPIAIVQFTQKNAQVRAIVDRMKPAHTNYSVTNAVGILAETADNLAEITAVGA